MKSWSTYRQRGVFVQLVFGSDAEASVVTAGGPGQSDRCLQLVVHLLVDGAAELGPIITEREKKEFRDQILQTLYCPGPSRFHILIITLSI